MADDLLTAAINADALASQLHDLMYDVPLPEQASEEHRTRASNLVWAIHERLRPAIASAANSQSRPLDRKRAEHLGSAP